MPESSSSTGASGTFRAAFFRDFLTRCYDVHGDNTDFLREAIEFPGKGSPKAHAKQRVLDGGLQLARKVGLVHARSSDINRGSQVLQCVIDDLEELDRFYSRLNDGYSRRLMVELLQFRVLGRYRVKLSRNDEDYWAKHDSVDPAYLREPEALHAGATALGRYELPGRSGPIAFHGHPLNVLNTFLLRQYEYRREGTHLHADEGDIVIDAGGCWGDTALYFADLVGSDGKVLVLEFVEENLKVLQANMNLNPALAPTIRVVPKAAWHRSGEALPYSSGGAGTTLRSPDGDERNALDERPRASTTSIDDLVATEGLEKVDYIKMDIEGAELNALEGAEATIRSFRPKLAISVYHDNRDFAVIPKFIDDLGLDYDMYMDHFTIHSEETMLFAWPRVR